MNLPFRTISVDELEPYLQTMGIPFSFDPQPAFIHRLKQLLDQSKLQAVYDDDQIVATFGWLDLELAVPGQTITAAGTSLVSVLPTHRRRGILRQMMTQHLNEVYQSGVAVAALWASETGIYGRFGYGPATDRAISTLAKPYAQLRQTAEPEGAMRMLTLQEALEQFPKIFDVYRRERPGTIARSRAWWEYRTLNDSEEMRHGATSLRLFQYSRGDQPAGYVMYRTQREPDEVHTVEVNVLELIGIDRQAELALWEFLFGIDLVQSLKMWNLPVDDPLRWWLVEPRRLQQKIEDALWIRPVNVIPALCQRNYCVQGDLVFRLSDSLCPWNEGTYRLQTNHDGTANCQQTDAQPQLELTAHTLGAIYLGGRRLYPFAQSGFVQGDPAAIRLADAIFSWDPQPWCPEIF